MKHLPRVAVSCGDPNGVGPEILLRSLREISEFCQPVLACHPKFLAAAAKLAGIKSGGDFPVSSPPEADPPRIEPGRVSAEAGEYSLASFTKALDLVDSGDCAAAVTLPVNKLSWSKAGSDFKGHTDLLSARYGETGIMALGHPDDFIVLLYTDHIALRDVPDTIREPGRLEKFLRRVDRHTPPGAIAVCGFNPHAGENGLFGDEDGFIAEALEKINVEKGETRFAGPIPADSAFIPASLETYRFFVSFYHDQGLIPVKTLLFDKAVNFTVGLPVRRTSVDHGTAFDIAYSGKVPSCRSFVEAVRYHSFF